jgi:hypothetical protein
VEAGFDDESGDESDEIDDRDRDIIDLQSEDVHAALQLATASVHNRAKRSCEPLGAWFRVDTVAHNYILSFN